MQVFYYEKIGFPFWGLGGHTYAECLYFPDQGVVLSTEDSRGRSETKLSDDRSSLREAERARSQKKPFFSRVSLSKSVEFDSGGLPVEGWLNSIRFGHGSVEEVTTGINRLKEMAQETVLAS